MATDFEPVTVTKDGKTRKANSPAERVRLRADGWVETPQAARQRQARQRRAANKATTPAKPRTPRKTATKKAAPGREVK